MTLTYSESACVFDIDKNLAGRVIPTRRTFGVTCPSPTIPVSPAAIPTPLAKPPPLPEAVVNEDDVNEQVERYGVGFG